MLLGIHDPGWRYVVNKGFCYTQRVLVLCYCRDLLIGLMFFFSFFFDMILRLVYGLWVPYSRLCAWLHFECFPPLGQLHFILVMVQ